MTYRLSEIISPAFAESHKAIKNGEADELIESGGRGSMKSTFVGTEVVLELLRHPERHAVIWRRYQNTLRDSVYNQILWSIDMLGLSEKFKYTTSPMEITYKKTGQKILFRGLDKPEKAKGIKLPFGYVGIVWFEELDQFDGAEQIRSVEQSLLRGGSRMVVFKTYNPPAMVRNWVHEYAREAKKGKITHHTTYLSAPSEWLGERFITDAEYLKATNHTAYRHEYLGEIVGSGTAVFENLQIRTITEKEISQFDRISSGVDWGFYPDPWAFNRVHYDSARRTLYIFDELTRKRTSNQATGELVLARIPEDELVTADSAEEKSCADYRSYGIRCRGAEKGPGSVSYSMKWLQSLTAIIIDPERCPDTVKEFSEYEYERDKKTGEVMEGYPDTANHHIDAVRYATNSIWKRRGQ